MSEYLCFSVNSSVHSEGKIGIGVPTSLCELIRPRWIIHICGGLDWYNFKHDSNHSLNFPDIFNNNF